MSDVVETLGRVRVLPVLSVPDAAGAEAACRALLAGGCGGLGLPFFPGVATPSEIERARVLGCETVKVFPAAAVGGVAFLRAVSAPYRDVRFVPTGGIDGSNLADYLAVPSVLACGGSWLCDQALIRAGRFDEVERLAREAVEAAG